MILVQAVTAAQRELSGCEERSEEDTDTQEDETARWLLDPEMRYNLEMSVDTNSGSLIP